MVFSRKKILSLVISINQHYFSGYTYCRLSANRLQWFAGNPVNTITLNGSGILSGSSTLFSTCNGLVWQVVS